MNPYSIAPCHLQTPDEFDPNDPGVDMSEWLAEFNSDYPDHDRIAQNADHPPI